MNPKSDNLFHFTKSPAILKSILKNGFFPRYCLEDIKFLGKDFMAHPMVSFCDIPISRITEHTSFYGGYGLGLTKEWGLKNGLCPVVYTPLSGPISDMAIYLLNLKWPEISENNSIQEMLAKHFFRIISLTKPISGTMKVSGNNVPKEFYQENEWRYVPDVYTPLYNESEYEDKKTEYNDKYEKMPVQFVPADIKYIFVKNDLEIAGLFDFINDDLTHYPLNERKILCSRIISLETIMSDL